MPVLRVDLFDHHLRVHFDGESARHADFHYRWLRHNSELDRHPKTNERILDSSELPDDVRPRTVSVVAGGEAIAVGWSDVPLRRDSVYEKAWLIEHAYAADRVAVPPPPSDVSRLVMAGGALDAASWLKRIDDAGAVVVRGATLDTEAIIEAFAAVNLRVTETHFGRIEDLRSDNTTNKNTDQLGYTTSAVNLHTDQPFLERPPRYQLLHCMQQAPEGGENVVVDAKAAAEYLREVDAQAYELLSTVPVPFDRRQKAFRSLVTAPILGSSEEGFRIRYSYFTMAPYKVPFGVMAPWYRAYDTFARLVRDPRHGYPILLEKGDFLLYDNWRMLHARTAFRGARWLRGVYFDR